MGSLKGDQLLLIYVVMKQYISDNIDKKGHVDVMYTDSLKAFDRIDRDILLDNLQHLGKNACFVF